jgi:hypothetical protein
MTMLIPQSALTTDPWEDNYVTTFTFNGVSGTRYSYYDWEISGAADHLGCLIIEGNVIKKINERWVELTNEGVHFE